MVSPAGWHAGQAAEQREFHGAHMLRFAVFDEQGPARDWPLRHACLLGPDDVGVRGDIRFEAGEIICDKRSTGACALALQYDAGSAGMLVLQTCLLPDSRRPYVLSHELARHRIKTFITKCEEWQMFELSSDHPAIRLWEEARELFTLGLNDHDPVARDRYGRQSLDHAVEATERLAMAHAEVLLHRRYAGKPASNTTLGVRVNPQLQPDPFAATLSREFDLLYLPISWRDLMPAEGEYRWEPIDRWVTWAHRNSKPVVAGPLVCFQPGAVPGWMNVWKHDYDTTRDLVYDYVQRVIARYQSYISIWSIAAGLNVNADFQFTAAQMLDLTRMVNLLVKQGAGAPGAKRGRTMIEIVQPFGEHVSQGHESIPPLTYIDMLVQEGIRVDCYGLQLAFGDGSGLPARDLMLVSHMLDRFFLLELPLLITRIGVPSALSSPSRANANDGGSVGAGANGTLAPDGGYWQEPWSPEVQQRWLGKAFGMALSKPHVESFFWADLCDHPANDIPHTGLLSADQQPKPALKRLIEMRRRLRKPLGPLKLPNKVSV
jgi:hypothetical protein